MTWNIDQGLSIGYKNRPVATVTEDILFGAGQITLLLGLNGQGKTTLMKTLAGLLPPLAGRLARTRVLYLSDDVDFPGNLSPVEIIQCLDSGGKFRAFGKEMLAGLEIENKRYSLLSKGNRQKARVIFAEIISRVRKVHFVGLDEPFAGLDFQARDFLVKRWLENTNRERHLLVSMHPSEIPVTPSQILLVSKGKIWTVPPTTSWPEIRVLLQKPELAAI
jgi:zinc/manganese transport system ATP-binding protein